MEVHGMQAKFHRKLSSDRHGRLVRSWMAFPLLPEAASDASRWASPNGSASLARSSLPVVAGVVTSGNEHDLAVGSRLNHRMMRLSRFRKGKLLANHRAQGAIGQPGDEGGMHAHDLSL